jgi:hypothetical protein
MFSSCRWSQVNRSTVVARERREPRADQASRHSETHSIRQPLVANAPRKAHGKF